MTSDIELLCRYAKTGAQDAFAELVHRHVNLVYSAALRQVNGDAHLAQDVAQSVFIDLARKADSLSGRNSLTGWLYTSTHFAASKAVRAEIRRRIHEKESQPMESQESELDWEELSPMLDSVMHELDDTDREMVLMRYFENRRLGEISRQFAVSEDAVRKRLERALEKLRSFLVKRGIKTAAALPLVISTHAVQVAPAGLAVTLAAGIMTVSPVTTVTTTLAKTLAMTTFQKTLIGTLISCVGICVFEGYHAACLQDEIRTLREQQGSLTAQMERVTAEATSASNRLSRAENTSNSHRLMELLRLRNEVGQLRKRQGELEKALASTGSRQQDIPSANQQANVASPFQIQLVVDEADENSQVVTNSSGSEALNLSKTPLMDYSAIRSATATPGNASGNAIVTVELSPDGRDLLSAISKEHLNQRLAIVVNGKLCVAPLVRSEMNSDKVEITGNFTMKEAQELAEKINQAIH